MKNKKFKVIVLFSGEGTNLQSIIDNCPDIDIPIVVTDNPTAPGIQRAAEKGIPTIVFAQNSQTTRKQYCEKLESLVKKWNADLIVLAGFMKILTKEFINKFSNKVINTHPSLLPKYKGLHTHKHVVINKDREHGITIHWVTEELDNGPIILQRKFVVEPKDTEKTLQLKIKSLEHVWYPWIINNIAGGDLKYDTVLSVLSFRKK